jgi:hypothetical protein
METVPAGVRLQDPGVQLADLNGDGRIDLLVSNGTTGGYYPLTFQGNWNEHGFVRYEQLPGVNLDAPDVRLMDLNGDGIIDALRTGPQFELFFQNPCEGWTTVELRERQDLERFPDISFSDRRVKLADMNGDGLQDIVLVQSGCVDYWPYLGHGRWAQRITMLNSPIFDEEPLYESFSYDPKRLLLGDVDGDGLADLIYVGAGCVTVWINQSGNGWSEPVVLHGTPFVTDMTAVRLADVDL